MKIRQKNYIIAIDGPAGSGKGTVAKKLADRLSILYIDTGAMYRAVAYYFVSHQITINEQMASKCLANIEVKLNYQDGVTKVYLNDTDITAYIRSEEISMGASLVSALACVREKLVSMQQKMGQEQSIVMEGRDIASVVFPNADIKVYLDADIHKRAARRKQELESRGMVVAFEQVLADMKERDRKDSTRTVSPLVKVKDAFTIDSTDKTVEEVVQEIIKLVKQKKILG